MIRQFLQLEWRSFFRSASFKANIIIKIILGIGACFYAAMVFMLGIAAFYGLKEKGLEPLLTINHYLIYWWAFDLVFRYFLQKTPVMWVRPLLPLPFKKKNITHYLMGKSAFSFFNIYPFFFFAPFSVALLLNGYSVIGVICWHLAMMGISYFNNYLNLAVNNKDSVFISLAVVLAALGLSQYFHWFDITVYTAPVFQAFYQYPGTFLVLFAAAWLMYRYNFRYFYRSLYLDDLIQKKSKAATSHDYMWLNRFGLMGTFLKNDLHLILRNKRSRNTLWASFFFLFYGLLIFSNPVYRDSNAWMVFAGIFISGGFLFTFGGFVPSWDSAYYPLMMSQNIKYREYLASKWWLMVVATLAAMVLSAFYLILGTKFYLAILAGGIYNIGVNAHIVLLSGAYVKTPIDLSSGKKPFGDKKAFNLKTLLLAIPKILLPLVIYYIFYWLFDELAGYLAIAIAGLLGLTLRNTMFSLVEKVYKEEKYSTLQAYKQKG